MPVLSSAELLAGGFGLALRQALPPALTPKAPTEFTSLLRHFSPDAITGVANGSTVQTLPDLSPAASPATQATAANRPVLLTNAINGRTGVRFDGVNHFMSFTRQAEVRTILIVMRFNEPQNAAATIVSLLGDTNSYDLISPDPSTSPGLCHTVAIPSERTRAEVWINGVYTSSFYSAVRHNGFVIYAIRVPEGQTYAFSQIGQDRGTTTRRTNGIYGDIVLFSERLSDLDFAQAQQYMLDKYRIERGTKGSSPALFHAIHAGDSISIARGAVPAFVTQTIANLGGPAKALARPVGVSGSTAREWAGHLFGAQMYNAAFPWLINNALPQIFFFFCGTNDLNIASYTAEEIYRDLRYVWAQARSLGMRIIAFTVLSRGQSGVPADFNFRRATLNALIRSDPTLYDALADVAASEVMGYDGAHSDTTYFNDLVHPTLLGAQTIGHIAHAAVLSLPEFGGRYRKFRLGQISAAGSITLPAGVMIDSIVIRNLTTSAVTGGIKIGTTAGGADILAAQAVAASSQVDLPASTLLKRQLNRSTLNTIHIDAVTAWNGAALDIEAWGNI